MMFPKQIKWIYELAILQYAYVFRTRIEHSLLLKLLFFFSFFVNKNWKHFTILPLATKPYFFCTFFVPLQTMSLSNAIEIVFEVLNKWIVVELVLLTLSWFVFLFHIQCEHVFLYSTVRSYWNNIGSWSG